jgi:predicted alpha-1,2-mannosidase
MAGLAEELADVPNPLMGTNNDGKHYSRGNQYPAITVPFGMTAWSPVTGDPGSGWFFDFDDQKINAIKATHQPSPWAKDYGSFEIMAMTGALKTNPKERASAFSREDEICEAYHYRAGLEDYDIVFEVAPTLRCASFNITYPETEQAWLLFDNQEGEGRAQVDAGKQKVTGRVLNGRTNPGFIYFCATFDKSFVASGTDKGLAYVQFATGAGEAVNMKIGTSWISEAQAEANVRQEIGTADFETVKAKARAIWNKELNKIKVEGGTGDDRTIFYSCLYRGLTFPKMMWEAVDGAAKYYSPYDQQIHAGKLWAGNGFWDTFRAVWPFFTIMYPELTGEMLDGWVNSYKEGGWTVKWSNPGYWDCMIGTHTDSLFADAYLKGITNFDIEAAYEASVKNATVQGKGGTGRVGLESYLELGYVAADQTPYSAARTLEFCYDDFCVAQFAKALGRGGDVVRFRTQALNYQNIFSPEVGFFRGRNADGSWRTPDADFKPHEWGHEWIEGCAWHYIAAPMHDGAGLAELYGGRAGFEQKLDDLFAAPTDFDKGSYSFVIHEIQEAYDIGEKYGFGQYAHGNQPAQHLIYMYNYAGRPSKTQYWARKAMNDLYQTGLSDGYGYCGDEDNGQTSLWYVFSAMGLYPAAPGFPEYCIGSPLFDRVTLQLESGKTLTIDAKENSARNVYVQDAKLNGTVHERNFITHGEIMDGGTLEFTMGAGPSEWGTAEIALPSSISD